jgi:serine phosphatase RsbU (regulator of sigma subunit)/HAMP domain-containing protein
MLKNVEIESQKVLNKLNNINYRTSALINSRFNFGEMDVTWNKSITTYTAFLNQLTENESIRTIGKDTIVDLQESWELLQQQTLENFKIKIQSISKSNIKSKVGNFTLNYASHFKDINNLLTFEESLVLSDFVSYQQFVVQDLRNYTILMNKLIENIQQEIVSRINLTFRVVITSLSLVIIATVISIFIYAGGLSGQIKTIEKTAQLVTAGNFDVKLDIQTSEEFKSLSTNFNSFTEILWTRLDAIRTIMKDMANISGEMDDIKTIEEILNLAMNNSAADAGAIFIYEEESNELIPVYVKGNFPPPYPLPASITQHPDKAFRHFEGTHIIPGENAIGKVAQTGNAMFIKNTDASRELPGRWSNDPLHISSFMAIPLMVSNKVLGVLALVKTEPYVVFTDLNFTNMKTFGEYTALSIDNQYKYTELKEKFELSRELSIATDIQQGLRLRKIPKYKTMQVSTFHNTAKGISGDYYDIFNISSNKTAVVICDVAGKGIPAALVMVMIRTILRVIAHSDRDAGTMLSMLNSNISGKVGNDQYATMGIMILDHVSGELTFSNAAHIPLHVYRHEDSRFVDYDTEGLPLGVEKETVYSQQEIKLNPGDIAAICTDGLTEARNTNGQEFSINTLLREIKNNSDKSADEITEIIGNEMNIFLRGSNLFDDQSLLLMKYEG